MSLALLLLLALSCLASCTIAGDDDWLLHEQAAKMLIVGFRGNEPDKDVRHYLADLKVGGVILFDRDLTAGGALGSRNVKSPEQLKRLCHDLKTIAGRDIFIAIDEEGGKVDRLKAAYGFPATLPASDLGARNDSTFTYKTSARIASTLRDAGINLNFAPSVDVNVNPDCPIIGKLGRSFSADTMIVADNARWFVEAHHAEAVLTAIKHFPGHGSAKSDSHLGFTDVTDTWSKAELAPFRQLIDAGVVDIVMTAHIFNARQDSLYPATLSKNVVDGLLRRELGYDGVVASDDLYMDAIANHFTLREAVVRAINAGVDMLVLGNNSPSGFSSNRPDEVIDIIVGAVKSGDIARERINEASQRIDSLYLRQRILSQSVK